MNTKNHLIQRTRVLFLVHVALASIVGAQKMPNTLTACQTKELIQIDGLPNESSWYKAEWSPLFVNIQDSKKPKFETRVKLLWDRTNIYVLANLKDSHVWGNLRERDTMVYFNNAFEIFIDPDGDTHNYFEYQVNALNTVWDLFLSKPYRNGNKVLGAWNCQGLQTAVSVQGTLNDASDVDDGWTVEMAIPWSSNHDTSASVEPPENQYWRINFSRVHWDFDLAEGHYTKKIDTKTNKSLPASYWVWSPHHEVNLHQPEKWGYVFFTSELVGGEPVHFSIPKDEYVKTYLYGLYRELLYQHTWKTTEEETFEASKEIESKPVKPIFEKYVNGFTISAKSPFTEHILTINRDGKFEKIALE